MKYLVRFRTIVKKLSCWRREYHKNHALPNVSSPPRTLPITCTKYTKYRFWKRAWKNIEQLLLRNHMGESDEVINRYINQTTEIWYWLGRELTFTGLYERNLSLGPLNYKMWVEIRKFWFSISGIVINIGYYDFSITSLDWNISVDQ